MELNIWYKKSSTQIKIKTTDKIYIKSHQNKNLLRFGLRKNSQKMPIK